MFKQMFSGWSCADSVNDTIGVVLMCALIGLLASWIGGVFLAMAGVPGAAALVLSANTTACGFLLWGATRQCRVERQAAAILRLADEKRAAAACLCSLAQASADAVVQETKEKHYFEAGDRVEQLFDFIKAARRYDVQVSFSAKSALANALDIFERTFNVKADVVTLALAQLRTA